MVVLVKIIENLMRRIHITVIKSNIVRLQREIVAIGRRPENTDRHIEPCTHVQCPFDPVYCSRAYLRIGVTESTEFVLPLRPGVAAKLNHLKIIIVENLLNLTGVFLINLCRDVQFNSVNVLSFTNLFDSVDNRDFFSETADVKAVAQICHPPYTHAYLISHLNSPVFSISSS